ncbi:unnamed protein product [Amoebophrya sp. A25]|nr:unnamed protein product [Amoebophrya sp. A25]|eukprot:GSA25T00015571001.1
MALAGTTISVVVLPSRLDASTFGTLHSSHELPGQYSTHRRFYQQQRNRYGVPGGSPFYVHLLKTQESQPHVPLHGGVWAAQRLQIYGCVSSSTTSSTQTVIEDTASRRWLRAGLLARRAAQAGVRHRRESRVVRCDAGRSYGASNIAAPCSPSREVEPIGNGYVVVREDSDDRVVYTYQPDEESDATANEHKAQENEHKAQEHEHKAQENEHKAQEEGEEPSSVRSTPATSIQQDNDDYEQAQQQSLQWRRRLATLRSFGMWLFCLGAWLTASIVPVYFLSLCLRGSWQTLRSVTAGSSITHLDSASWLATHGLLDIAIWGVSSLFRSSTAGCSDSSSSSPSPPAFDRGHLISSFWTQLVCGAGLYFQSIFALDRVAGKEALLLPPWARRELAGSLMSWFPKVEVVVYKHKGGTGEGIELDKSKVMMMVHPHGILNVGGFLLWSHLYLKQQTAVRDSSRRLIDETERVIALGSSSPFATSLVAPFLTSIGGLPMHGLTRMVGLEMAPARRSFFRRRYGRKSRTTASGSKKDGKLKRLDSVKKIKGEDKEVDSSTSSKGHSCSDRTIGPVGIVPGGFPEIGLGEGEVYLKNRKGVIKQALKYGLALVPIYCDGEVEKCYSQANVLPKSVARWLNRMDVPTTLFWSSYFPAPNPVSGLRVLIGAPLQLPQMDNPTRQEIDLWHANYVEALQGLVEKETGKRLKIL